MNSSSGASDRWHFEFGKVIGCVKCSKATDPNLLRDHGENVPQPGYIGAGYEQTKLLLVGQNPAVPPANLRARDRNYTAALRALRDAPTPQSYAELQVILNDFIPTWPVHGQHFPLEECNLVLADIAYCNLVRCRAIRTNEIGLPENATPNDAIATSCRRMHFEPWLDMLKPKCVVFIGLWACRYGGTACSARDIPHIAVNRSRSLPPEARIKNRNAVRAFVDEHIGNPRGPAINPRNTKEPVLRPYLPHENSCETNPKRTLELLKKLEMLGFNDEAFWRLHHFRLRGKKETIAGFRAYCERTSTFVPSGTNQQVHKRLYYVLQEYDALGVPPGRTQVLIDLADAAFVVIPPF